MTASAVRARRRRARLTKAERKADYAAKAARIVRRRGELVRLLSPELKCAGCGNQAKGPAELIVDHVDGKSWTASKLSSSQRIARYWREYKAGIPMRALCSTCSDRDGAYRLQGKTWVAPLDGEVPF